MGVYTGIPRCASQRLVVFVRNVLASLRVAVSLCETEIDNVNYVLFFAMANQKIIRFHITMNEVIIVQEFQPLNHLISNH